MVHNLYLRKIALTLNALERETGNNLSPVRNGNRSGARIDIDIFV